MIYLHAPIGLKRIEKKKEAIGRKKIMDDKIVLDKKLMNANGYDLGFKMRQMIPLSPSV